MEYYNFMSVNRNGSGELIKTILIFKFIFNSVFLFFKIKKKINFLFKFFIITKYEKGIS